MAVSLSFEFLSLKFWISKKDIDGWNVFSKKITFERNALFSFQNFVVEWFDGQVFMQLLTSFLGAINLACYIFNVWNRCAFAPVRYQRSDCRFTHCDTDVNYIFNLYFTNNYKFLHARIAQPIHIELIELIVNMKIIKFNKLISFMSMWSSLFHNHCFWPEFTWFFNACSWKIPSRTLLKT